MKKTIAANIVKILILLLAATAQIAVIVLPTLWLEQHSVHFYWLSEVIAIIIILYLLKSDINPIYKIPWIIMLLVAPVFGGMVYIVYGRVRFSKSEIKRSSECISEFRKAIQSRPGSNGILKEIEPGIGVQAEYLLKFADAPVYTNTTTRYFPLGDDVFPVLLEELKNAKNFIFMEFFIIEEGIMLDSIISILEEKANDGLDIRFMYDSFGSILRAPHDMVKRLEKKGIKCFEFNSFKTAFDSRYNNRDHRKICVIDGSVGFTGGFNLADEYINQKTVYGHWKDTAIMIKGDAVWSLTAMFLALWDSSKKEKDEYQRYIPSAKFTYNDGFIAPYTDYPLDDEPVGKNVYLNMINRANSYVYIMTPYLVPDTVLVSALENAAKNGIDVRIIMPGIPDKKIVYMLGQSFYPVLLKAGVKIYEYTPGFVHAKVFLSDDELAVVGTINLDYRSLAHHFEDAVWMYKASAINEIKKDFMETINKSEEVSKEGKKESVLRRILIPILRLFAPLF